MQSIDFVGLAAALLDRAASLVSQWLPGGHREGHEWVEARTAEGGIGDSLRINLTTGVWAYFAGDERGGDLISLYAFLHNQNNAQAARDLIEQFRWHTYLRDQTDGAPVAPAAPAARPRPAQPAADAREMSAADPDDPAAAQRWRPIVPVPAFAPEPARFVFGFRDSAAGEWRQHEAVKVWPYVFDGERLGYVARFERVSSKGEVVKDTLPLTWCEDTADERRSQGWRWKQWAEPRPLYVPAQRFTPAQPVVIVEGEKCAQAGHELLGDEFDFAAWPGGAKAWSKARWSLLAGRTVFLWPDADAQRWRLSKAEREAGIDPATKEIMPLARQPGYVAMVRIGELLHAEHGCTVYMTRMGAPGVRPAGWDIADAIAAGWTREQVRDHIRAATVFESPDAGVRAQSASTPSTAAARERVDDDGEPAVEWRNWLLRSASTGAIAAVRENVVIALDGRPEKDKPGIAACAGLIRYNEFSNNVEKARATPWGTPAGDWLEPDELMMGDWLVREHGMPSMKRGALEEAVLIVARRHAYHPVREQMIARRGRWDGIDRLDTWLQRCCLDEDEHEEALQRYLALAGRWFLMGMCARVMPESRRGREVVVGPGCAFQYMLVLESPQGWGKSTLAAMLGGDYYADTGLDIAHKDSLMNIQGISVYEWSELESLARAEVGAIKRFISSSSDRFRATFDRRPAKYPRQVVFIGTTNEQHYLHDITGNRRFWPIRLTRPPDLAWLRANLDQLLAEAVHRVDAGERFWPTLAEQRGVFDAQQRARTVESSLESAILNFLHNTHQHVPPGEENGTLIDRITLQSLLERIGFAIDKQTDAIAKKASAVMHALGWQVKRQAVDDAGRRPRIYVRPKHHATPTALSAFPTEGLDDPPF